ncbi:hypothetical protein M409DRAFT_49935 [Zasmidium cellare ATCC 36951]|uniref:FAD/NAD(P)-binding domain-containing protein n=1 Tax=Zasmidium cellare ATCC 36951 TaxID=1080233 RepID=A0A6A6CYA6_ZASCE|nr:uncharacterized protein M409DRAFT_49935 [Zasmidium cellare ATCC 36951]KAF2172207.1 hypothetical protein M409DRAFT_49935 [Zasmidium cellare ATCC 36951]
MAETRNIVILGASYAGSGAAHYFLKHVYPHLPKSSKVTYRVILVDPSAKWYLRHASPRAIASEELMPTKHVFLNTVDGFKQYGDAFQFIQGSATSWNPETRIVTISTGHGKEEQLPYHALVLATGTKTTSPLFSLQGTPHTDIQAALRTVRDQVSRAKKIVIAGGGPAGVETAGELGEMLNGSAGWFSSWPSHITTEITLITNSSKLLPKLRESIAKQAETYLNRVGVEVRYNTKVSSATGPSNGKTTVLLHDGEELIADLYIPATGLVPMSEYVPSRLLDGNGYVKNNPETLRVDEAGPMVYAVGDIGTYSRNGIMDIMDGVPVVNSNLKRDLLAAHENVDAKPTGPDRKWKATAAETQLVPVGQSKGVGAVFGWRVPSIFVWLIKGRTFMISESAVKDSLMGKNWEKEKAWDGK